MIALCPFMADDTIGSDWRVGHAKHITMHVVHFWSITWKSWRHVANDSMDKYFCHQNQMQYNIPVSKGLKSVIVNGVWMNKVRSAPGVITEYLPSDHRVNIDQTTHISLPYSLPSQNRFSLILLPHPVFK